MHMKNTMILFFCLFIYSLKAQESPTGIFSSSADIGNPRNSGSSVYNSSDQSYSIRGTGYNIWFERDEFHFLFNRMKGDFILTANFRFEGEGVVVHRKTGWMLRNTLDDDSPIFQQHCTVTVSLYCNGETAGELR
jgi:hypothetical protein